MVDRAENDKRRHIKAYFEGSNALLAWLLIIVGVPMIFAFGLGLVMIAVGAYLLWQRKSKLSGQQIDKWAAEDFAAHNFIMRAWVMFGSPEITREPLVLRGIATSTPLSENVFSGEMVGDDGLTRSTPLSATVILCSAEQLGIYQAGLDLATGNRVNERFVEVFYQDVVGISTIHRTESLDLKKVELGLKTTNMNLAEIQKGLTRAKLRMNLTRLKTLFGDHIVDDVLQRDTAKIYRIDFVDGSNIAIPVRDGRPTRVANGQDDAQAGDEIARSMVLLRAFVREKKRAALLQVAARGSGSLV